MKVTSYENSKKLAEIGFKAESHAGWYAEGGFSARSNWKFDFPAFDLETILAALPKQICEYDSFGNYIGYNLEINWDGYEYSREKSGESRKNLFNLQYIWHNYEVEEILAEIFSSLEDESLADTAARLLIIILLHEKGIVKLNSPR